MIYGYTVPDSELANANAALSLCLSHRKTTYDWYTPSEAGAVNGSTGKFKSVVILIDTNSQYVDLPPAAHQVLELYGKLQKIA